MVDFPTSLVDFQRRFPDEAACAAWLFEARWPTGFRCPACDHDKAWPHGGKAFTYECAACGRQTAVTAGTIMHGSKLPLTVWFWAAYLMATHSNGISALQLQKLLALGSYKSAWLLRQAAAGHGRAFPCASGWDRRDRRDRNPPARQGRSDHGWRRSLVPEQNARRRRGRSRRRRARPHSPRNNRGAFPPPRCTVLSPPTWLKAQPSKPTDGQPIQARPTSLTIPMSLATWLPISCCRRSIASSPT